MPNMHVSSKTDSVYLDRKQNDPSPTLERQIEYISELT
jgi:hypothetical protein